MKHRRGLVIIVFIFVIGVIAGIAGAAYYLFIEDTKLRSEMEGLSRKVDQVDAGRQQLAAEVERALGLHALVGEELAHQNEEFGTLLNRGLGARDRELGKIQDAMANLEAKWNQAVSDVRSTTDKQAASLAELRNDVTQISTQLHSAAGAVDSLDARFRASGEAIREQLDSLEKNKEVRDPEAQERINACLRRIEAIESRIDTDLNWLQGEVRRINGRIDDLGHTLRRLETRQNP